jgi:hypothetical protein
MFGKLSTRSIAIIAVVSSAAGLSLGSPTSSRIVPVKGESINFHRTYTENYLKETNPYQHLEKTDLTLKNAHGLITATWKGTLRDFGYDEHYAGAATAICKPTGKRKLECNFDASTGTAYITGRGNGGISVTIPIGQAVQFTSKETKGIIQNAVLFGNDDDNNVFNLDRK